MHLRGRSLDARSAGDQRNDRTDQEHYKQHLGDPGGAGGESAKSQHARDDRDDKENHCIMKHEILVCAFSNDGVWLRGSIFVHRLPLDQGVSVSGVGFRLQRPARRRLEAQKDLL